MKKLLLIFGIILLIVSCAGLSVKQEGGKNYLADARTYYKFKDYGQAILSSRKALDNGINHKDTEEALYIINESAEELVTELKRNYYIKDEKWFKKEITKLKEIYGINIEFTKVGYEFILYYDKEAYLDLLDLNPKSPYIYKMQDRFLARNARFVTDPVYRYKEILQVISQYQSCYNRNPKANYAASLLMRIADLYLYLYENGEAVRKDIGISSKEVENYYKKATQLYTKIKKDYPKSEEALNLAYVIDNVKLRSEPTTKSKVIKRIAAGTMARIIDRSAKKQSISNMYYYWYKIKLTNGMEGWIYGFYLRTDFIR